MEELPLAESCACDMLPSADEEEEKEEEKRRGAAAHGSSSAARETKGVTHTVSTQPSTAITSAALSAHSRPCAVAAVRVGRRRRGAAALTAAAAGEGEEEEAAATAALDSTPHPSFIVRRQSHECACSPSRSLSLRGVLLLSDLLRVSSSCAAAAEGRRGEEGGRRRRGSAATGGGGGGGEDEAAAKE